MDGEVAAHEQGETHRYVMHFPEHPARAHDPHYADFDHYHRKTRPTARCFIGERIGFGDCKDAQCRPCPPPADGGEQPGLELHHAHVEFSLQNGVDLAALEKDYPGISDPSQVGAWVESEANFRWLCVLPGSPVLMADGSRRAIEHVLPGEWVIGGDGRPDLVIAASRKRYRGEVARLGPAALTAAHRVSTSAGWLPIGQVAEQVRMLGSDVVSLRCIEDEVGWSVVRPVPVDVVDALARQQQSSDHPFHDESVLHDLHLGVIAPDPDTDIALPGDLRRTDRQALARDGLQRVHATGVGAVATRPRLPVSTGGVLTPAALTGQRRDLGWLTVDEPVRASYWGWVHDLTIAHSHSFVVGGVVVHNCAWHHRGAAGAHTASHSDWEASQYVQGLIATVPK